MLNTVFKTDVQDRLFNRLSRILIIGFTLIFIILAMSGPNRVYGEQDDYVIATISMQQHGSLNITSQDVEQLRLDFPELYQYIKSNYDNKVGYPIGKDGNQYPFYLATYSISIIPIKWILEFIGVEQQKAYYLGNVLYYSLALFIVYSMLKVTEKSKFLTLLLLICTPTVFYYSWGSAEMYICSLIIISLVFFINDNHFWAVLFCAGAATLNPTINAIGIFIIIDFLVMKIGNITKTKQINHLKYMMKQTLLIGLCYLPALILPIYNFLVFGRYMPQSSMSSLEGLFGRFLAYWIDLNFGFLPYFPLLLILSFITFVIGLVKKNRKVITLTLGLVLCVLLYSLMSHINCGMTLMSRYNSWSFPVLVFLVTTQLTLLVSRKSVKVVISVLQFSSAIISITIISIFWRYNAGSFIHFSPVANYILDTAPELYNPLPSTFASRIYHVDGGYELSYETPTIYTNNKGYVRKILVPKGMEQQVFEMVAGDNSSLQKLSSLLKRSSDQGRDYSYINIPSNLLLILSPPHSFNPLLDKDLDNSGSGIYDFDGTYNWFSPNATMTLNGSEILSQGLEFTFYTAPKFRLLTNDTVPTLSIEINGMLIENIILSSDQFYDIVISADDLPDTDEYGCYRINLTSNCEYNPAELGDSNDNRDLSIAVTYIGTPR